MRSTSESFAAMASGISSDHASSVSCSEARSLRLGGCSTSCADAKLRRPHGRPAFDIEAAAHHRCGRHQPERTSFGNGHRRGCLNAFRAEQPHAKGILLARRVPMS